MDRWGRITGTPLVLPPVTTGKGAIAGYPRRTPHAARALAFAPFPGGPPSGLLEAAAGDAGDVDAAMSPEASERKVLHAGQWVMAAVGDPSAPVAVHVQGSADLQVTPHAFPLLYHFRRGWNVRHIDTLRS